MIAVTGATGHLGNTLIRELVSQGSRVRAVVRASSNRSYLDDLDVEVAVGDLLDLDSLNNAFTGTETVYHCAAYITILPEQSQALFEANVRGTEHVIKACMKAGVRRLVYVSTIEALDWNTGGRPVSETSGYHPESTIIDYGRTKAEASLLVLSAVEEGLDAVITIPTAFLGPNDYKISPMGSLVVDFASGKLPAYVDGGFDFADVRDVAAGTIEAGRRGRSGESYLLGGRYITVPEIMAILEDVTGRKKPGFKAPFSLAMFGARFGEKRALKTGKVPKFTRASLTILKQGPVVDIMKAKTELDYHPRDIEKTFSDSFHWFREKGYLK